MLPKAWYKRFFDRPVKKKEEGGLLLSTGDAISLHQAMESIFCAGQIGSGKTSGPGQHIARWLLSRGMGGLVLCAKTDEGESWLRYCEQTGRSDDVIHVTPNGPHKIDVIDYEITSRGGTVESACSVLEAVAEANGRGKAGNSHDPYWQDSANRGFRAAAHLIYATIDGCSLTDIAAFCKSLPKSPNELNGDGIAPTLMRMYINSDSYALKSAAEYVVEWAHKGDKERASVYSHKLNTIESTLSGPFTNLISSGETNFRPEDTQSGKIIILDLPVNRWQEPAQGAQIAIKMLFQRAALRRNPSEAKPSFIWADEAQTFVVPDTDAAFQAVSRQYKNVSVSLTQNLPLLVSSLGGTIEAKEKAHAWLANYRTFILCNNSDADTNEYFSRMLGMKIATMFGGSSSPAQYDPMAEFMGQPTGTAQVSWSTQYMPQVMASEFSHLAKGGTENDLTVEAIVFQSGRRFSNGKSFVRCTFNQEF